MVDAHAYFGAHMPEGMLRPAHDGEGLVRVLDEAGVDIAVISAPDWIDVASNEAPPYSESTRAVFAAAERFPDRLVPLVRVNPNWKDQSIAAFTEFARHPLCRGLKLHPQWDYFPVASKTLVDPLLALCDKHGLPVFFSAGTYPAAQPMLFMGIATKWPNLKIGLVHAGLRLNHDIVIVADRCPNVAVVCTPQVAPPTVATMPASTNIRTPPTRRPGPTVDDADTRVPTDQSVRLQAALQAAGRTSTLVLVPGAQHGFTPAEDAVAQPLVDAFLAARLK